MPASGQLETSWGTISFELDADVAPESCKAFIDCILRGDYNGGYFFRTVRSDNDRGNPPIDVIQAHARTENAAPNVRHESTQLTGLRHQKGTLSLPRTTPGSATGAGFFICLKDTPELDHGGQRNPDGEGFAAFGRITHGMDIIRRIHSAPCLSGGPTSYLEGQLLEDPVIIRDASAATTSVPSRTREPGNPEPNALLASNRSKKHFILLLLNQLKTSTRKDPKMKSPPQLNARQRQFIDNFAQTWRQAASNAMDGRVLGYLLVMDEEYVSSADLGSVLSASPGSISVSTRRLLDHAMIRRHWIPGDRNHYFAAESDPWGNYLANGFEPSAKLREATRLAHQLIPDLTAASKERIQNATDYFTWIEGRKDSLVEEWEAYKKTRPSDSVSAQNDEDNQRTA